MPFKSVFNVLASLLAVQCLAVQAYPLNNPDVYDMVWRTGRATYYGGPTDQWSIHSGDLEQYQSGRSTCAAQVIVIHAT